MPITYPYLQYGGIWTPSQQADAKAAGTWPNFPVPYLYSWGQNNNGQLGLSNITYYSSPKQVGSLTNWVSLACGALGVLAIKSDGTLWAWGVGGETGLGNNTAYSSPKQVGALTNWSQVSKGQYSSLAIKTDGTLWAWGSNNNGQLGLGNRTAYSSPKQVGSLTNWLQVSGGRYHTAAVKTDGTLWTWGRGQFGALGLGNTTSYSSPKQVGSLTDWLRVSCGGYSFTISLKTDGTLWSWGQNRFGFLGLNNTTYYSSPKQIGALTTWSKFSTGYQFTLATQTNGTLWSWGRNDFGQLGINNGAATYRRSPVQIGALTTWLSVATSYGSGMAIKTDGTLWSWGQNNFGQLALNNTTVYSSPKQVGSLTTWQNMFGGCDNKFFLGIARITP